MDDHLIRLYYASYCALEVNSIGMEDTLEIKASPSSM